MQGPVPVVDGSVYLLKEFGASWRIIYFLAFPNLVMRRAVFRAIGHRPCRPPILYRLAHHLLTSFLEAHPKPEARV